MSAELDAAYTLWARYEPAAAPTCAIRGWVRVATPDVTKHRHTDTPNARSCLMGWRDDDLHLRIVGEPTNYFYGTQSEVRALPITRDGEIWAYAFYSVDVAENSAGLVHRITEEFSAREWYDHLREAYAAGVSAEDAILRLRGTVSRDGLWSVGTELRHATSKDALKLELNPRLAAAATTRRTTPAVTRDVIDAVLRGEMPSTREIDAAIANLDAAVSARPTPEPLLVAMPRTLESLPADLQVGMRIVEPTYLQTVFSTRQTTFPDEDAVLTLRVEENTPALFIDSENDTGPGTLLLGRGITWEVTAVRRDSTPLAIYGRMVRNAAEPHPAEKN